MILLFPTLLIAQWTPHIGPASKHFRAVDVSTLTWGQNQDFIILRILQIGDLESLRWLRSCLGDAMLRECLIRHKACDL
jgi:hypothetical protein